MLNEKNARNREPHADIKERNDLQPYDFSVESQIIHSNICEIRLKCK